MNGPPLRNCVFQDLKALKNKQDGKKVFYFIVIGFQKSQVVKKKKKKCCGRVWFRGSKISSSKISSI